MHPRFKSILLAAGLFLALGSLATYAAGPSIEGCVGSGEHCATVKKGIIKVKFVKAEGTPDIVIN